MGGDRIRAVVTGVGLLTPLGVRVDKVWERLIAGKSGITAVKPPELHTLTSKVAGYVPEISEDSEAGFDEDAIFSEGDKRRMSSFARLGLAAANIAIEDSGVCEYQELDKTMVSVVMGTGVGGFRAISNTTLLAKERGVGRIGPFFVPSSLANIVSGNISIKHGFMGSNSAVVSACASGAQAIADAVRYIRLGESNVVIAGGTEDSLSEVGIGGFCAMKALSTKYNDNPAAASRPWDRDRDGFVNSQGSGVLVLENYDHAKKRGAKIYAECSGIGASADAYHISAPHPDGVGAKLAMQKALSDSGHNLEDVIYINAHGTSTPVGDRVESDAVKHLFGDHAYRMLISSTKSAIGHMLGAAGAVEAIISILSMRSGVAPPTLNLIDPSDGCDLNYVPLKAQEMKFDQKSNCVMSNSFGFGGSNVSLVFSSV